MSFLLVATGSFASVSAPAVALAAVDAGDGASRTYYVGFSPCEGEDLDYTAGIAYDGGDGSDDEAIQAAVNAAAVDDTAGIVVIHLCGGTYDLSAGISITTGEGPDTEIVIEGSSSTSTVITRSTEAPVASWSFFGITGIGATFKDLAMTHASKSTGDGAAILSDADLTTMTSRFTDNSANTGRGGAVYTSAALHVDATEFGSNFTKSMGGAAYAKTMTLSMSYFHGNVVGVRGENNTRGGAVFGEEGVQSVDTTFTDNEQVFELSPDGGDILGGGAIAAGGPVAIVGGTFSSNSADKYGGAVLSWGCASEHPCGIDISGGAVFDGNTSVWNGGALNADGPVSISDATFMNNETENQGSGAINSSGSVSITDATFSENRSDGYYGRAGAISAVDVRVERSTFSGNSASGFGGAIQASSTVDVIDSLFGSNSSDQESGGAIKAAALVTVTGSTFSGNYADTGSGGAIDTSAATILNSTFYLNRAYAGDAIAATGAIEVTHGTFVGVGTVTITTGDTLTSFATIFTGGSCSMDLSAGTDNLTTDPSCPGDVTTGAELALQDLQNNMGPTWTVGLNSASVAIDAAESCAASQDQRGVPRPQGAKCDIGAFERHGGPLSLALSSGDDDLTIPYKTPLTLTFTLSPATTGDVYVYESSGYSDGTCPLTEGSCSFTFGTLPAGARTFYARFTGNDEYDAETAELPFEITKLSTRLNLDVSEDFPYLGDLVTFDLSVSTGDGSESVDEGTVVLWDGPPPSGEPERDPLRTCTDTELLTCSISTGDLSIGEHLIFAEYSADNYDESTAATTVTVLALPVFPAPTIGTTPQTITFTLPPYAYGATKAVPITLKATASSKLEVSYSSTTPTTCRLVGKVLTPLSAGTCTVTASQAGDATYAAASVTRSMTVITSKVRITLRTSFSVNGETRLSVPLIVPRGTRVTMSVTTGERAMSGKTVEVWVRYGTGRWQKLATKTLGIKLLNASFTFRARPDATYRWRWAGDPILHDQWSPSRRVLGL